MTAHPVERERGACAFVLAAPSSGMGKTTVALALMAAFRARGLVVQPFKVGPDFIDPSHHSYVCGRPSRNLDTWMMPPEANRAIFARHSATADVSIVEGVMGLFDGARRSSSTGSTAETASLLGLPIVLVVDASKMAGSAAALVHGFATYDPLVRVAGVIFNNVAGAVHYDMVSEPTRRLGHAVVLGYLPRDEQVRIPERHLGLLTADDHELPDQVVAHLAALAERHIDLDALLGMCRMERAGGRGEMEAPPHTVAKGGVAKGGVVKGGVANGGIADGGVVARRAVARIGVARDRAFSFYYEDNFDALRAAGAELVPFSPLNDQVLPPGLDAIYIGGGYPEVWARPLSENESMRRAVASFIGESRVVYAECGGLMYLAEGLRTLDGELVPMVGALPLTVQMTSRLQQFGYVDVTMTHDCLLGAAGTLARGHSFHYSRIESCRLPLASRYQLHYPSANRNEAEGYVSRRVLASYVHLHFRSNPTLAEAFVRHAVSGVP